MSKINKLFREELKVVNLGLESFHRELREKKVEVVHINWRPCAGGNKRMIELLNKLKK
ncbi:MAG: fdrA domain protein [Alkaliphilus sp.]|nr:fdrA domain protein [bacterium AH-315-L21]PHS34798.1 MAG: fdrA domain protein [Alkaliphilus sp.]